MVCCCLGVLSKLPIDKNKVSEDPENIGEILGVAKVFLFHGIKGYTTIKPVCLRPAAMNLPETVYIPPRGGNISRCKGRTKRNVKRLLGPLKDRNETPESPAENLASSCKYSSDSDTECFNSSQSETKVRLEAAHLFHSVIQEISGRDMFGYWPQIVASGSHESARVLTRSIIKEPSAKVRQSIFGSLTILLVNAKHFLIHADDSENPSFLTFFSTVGAMIRELHFALSLVLSYERNSTVLIQALKSAAALVQGTPYKRLKTGLATKLSRNCRPHIFHKGRKNYFWKACRDRKKNIL